MSKFRPLSRDYIYRRLLDYYLEHNVVSDRIYLHISIIKLDELFREQGGYESFSRYVVSVWKSGINSGSLVRRRRNDKHLLAIAALQIAVCIGNESDSITDETVIRKRLSDTVSKIKGVSTNSYSSVENEFLAPSCFTKYKGEQKNENKITLQDQIWQRLAEHINGELQTEGIRLNIPQRKQYRDRHLQYPKSQVILSDKQLRKFKSFFESLKFDLDSIEGPDHVHQIIFKMWTRNEAELPQFFRIRFKNKSESDAFAKLYATIIHRNLDRILSSEFSVTPRDIKSRQRVNDQVRLPYMFVSNDSIEALLHEDLA